MRWAVVYVSVCYWFLLLLADFDFVSKDWKAMMEMVPQRPAFKADVCISLDHDCRL